jgi:hypothetical protein
MYEFIVKKYNRDILNQLKIYLLTYNTLQSIFTMR